MKSKAANIIELLVILAAGILLILRPGATLNTAVRILGIAILVYGVFAVVANLLSKDDRSVPTLIVGCIAVIAGIVILAKPSFIVSILPICAGILVAVSGVKGVVEAFSAKKSGSKSWTTALILSVITVVLGVLLFANPFKTMETLVTVLGVILVYIGAAGLYRAVKN